jgi:hypothetical protein
MRIRHVLGIIALLTSGTGAQAQDVLAECGASTGRAYYLTPQDQGWVDDGITGGSLRFTADGSGNPNIIFTDATGLTIDAAADGAQLLFSRLDSDRAEFGVVAIYASTGVVETYNVYQLPGGHRRLLWTSNKPRTGPIGITKVAAYSAVCR